MAIDARSLLKLPYFLFVIYEVACSPLMKICVKPRAQYVAVLAHKHLCPVEMYEVRVVAPAVSSRPVTVAARFRSQATPAGTSGGQDGT